MAREVHTPLKKNRSKQEQAEKRGSITSKVLMEINQDLAITQSVTKTISEETRREWHIKQSKIPAYFLTLVVSIERLVKSIMLYAIASKSNQAA
eukprot:4502874-Ditylum_brightwellii.AAC.2